MNDRELLEMAANAAGISGDNYSTRMSCQPDNMPDDWYCWNPLEDDGDALRLAVKLHIDIELNNGAATAIWIDEDLSETHSVTAPCDEAFEGWEAKHAATRRAIVRAAAEIGRAMK